MRVCGVVCLVVALFWAPGLAVGRAARLRGIPLLSAAPVLTLGVAGTTAVGAELLGLRWSAAVMLVAVLVAVAAVRACATRAGGEQGAPRVPTAVRPWLLSALAAGVLAQLVPAAVGAGRPGRLLTAHDALAHFTMVRFVIDSGSASSRTIMGAHSLGGSVDHVYGSAWHAVTALAGSVPDAATVFNVAAVVPCALAWTLGLCSLTMSTFPSRPRTWCLAAAGSAAGISLPLYLVMRPEGMVPNALGVALVPGFVALVTAPWRRGDASWWSVVLVGGAGLTLTHPNASVAAGLVLLPWLVPRVRPVLVRLLARTSGRLVVAVAVAGCVGAAAYLVAGTVLSRVVAFEPESPLALWEALAVVLSGDATGMGWGSGSTVVLAAVVGALASRRREHARWLVLAAGLMVGLYLAATSPVPVLTDVDRLWYGEPRRFAPVMVAVLVPLAARGLDALPGTLRVIAARRARARPDDGTRPRTSGAVVAVALLAVSTALAASGTARLAHDTFGSGDADVRFPVADDDELRMLTRARTLLDRDVGVLGSPFAGSAHLYGLHGQRVVPPTYLTPEDADLRYVRRHLPELGSDPRVCEALDRLGVGYLYVDPAPWNTLPTHPNPLEAPERGVRRIDAGGSAVLYRITAC